MSIEYDEKGKIFTDIISKVGVPASVQTTTHLIQGQVHIRPDERIKDELDRDEPFLAMTDATVYAADGQELYRTKFIAVRRAQVVWVIPDEEKAKDSKEGKKK